SVRCVVCMPRPKRHHFVPRAYLDRFAGGDIVLVRRRDSKTFKANPVNVAVECGFYDVEIEGAKSSLVEELLARIDGPALAAMQSIDRTGRPPADGTEERLILAVFLALQNTRTPEQRERVLFPQRLADYVVGRGVTREVVPERLEPAHRAFR